MKLTEKQKALLKVNDWDIVDNEHGNVQWIRVAPEDGGIFGEVCEAFRLTGEGEDVKLLIVATSEEETNKT